MTEKYKNKEYLSELYLEKGYTMKEIAEENSISVSTVSKYLSKNDIESRRRGPKREITEEMLIEDIKSCSEEYEDRSITMQEYENMGKYSPNTAIDRFGCWSNALEECNLIPQKNISKEVIKQEVKEIYKRKSKNGKLKQQTFNKESTISIDTVWRKFGSWNSLLEEINIPTFDWEEDFTREKNPYWKGGYSKYYGPNWRKQRRKCRERDNHTCQRCGKTNDREPDVHHIKPVHEYDVQTEYKEMNRISNLICLCAKCHQEIEGEYTELDSEQIKQKFS